MKPTDLEALDGLMAGEDEEPAAEVEGEESEDAEGDPSAVLTRIEGDLARLRAMLG